MLEVGGGLGVLSEYLAERTAHVHVVEVDRRLEPPLRDALDPHPNATLHLADAVKLDLARARAAAEQGRREPAVRRRRERDPAHDRAAPRGDDVGRDGAEGGRRAVRRARRHAGVRGAVGAGPAGVRGEGRCGRSRARSSTRSRTSTRCSSASPAVPRRPSRACGRSSGRASPIAARRCARSLALAGGDRDRVRAALEAIGHRPDARAETLSPDDWRRLHEALR